MSTLHLGWIQVYITEAQYTKGGSIGMSKENAWNSLLIHDTNSHVAAPQHNSGPCKIAKAAGEYLLWKSEKKAQTPLIMYETH